MACSSSLVAYARSYLLLFALFQVLVEPGQLHFQSFLKLPCVDAVVSDVGYDVVFHGRAASLSGFRQPDRRSW